MATNLNIFLNKKILIYGLGKSGLSTFKFLKNKSDIFLYDDFQSNIKSLNIKKNLISYKNILKSNFDQIILSPGIDINKCKLSEFLKRNYDKIYSDLDIFVLSIVIGLPSKLHFFRPPSKTLTKFGLCPK